MGRRWRVAAALVAAVLVAACSAGGRVTDHRPTSPTSGPAASGHGPQPAWIITSGSVPRLETAGLEVAAVQADFDNPQTLLLDKGRVDRLLPRASPAMVFTSEAALARALHSGKVPAAVSWVLLDLEHWPLTPPGEQTDPIGALRAAVAAAHAANKRLLFTPAVDLLSAVAPGTPAPARFATFDRLIVRPGAALADGFEVQSQQTEATPDAASFVAAAVATARAAHPGAPVLAGLSTNPNGRRVTPADLLVIYDSARAAGAAGFWLNIPETSAECPACGAPQPAVAVGFLQSIRLASAGAG